MNLDKIDRQLRDVIIERKECIGFFVHFDSYYWIIDWEAHFNIDQKKNYDAALRHKYYPMSRDEYNKYIKEFREGMPTLTSELFPRYRDGQSAKVVSKELLHEEFFEEDEGQYAKLAMHMESELSFNHPMPEPLVDLRSRLFSKLPKFYVNFDRKIFMHMVRGRSYEAVVPDGWWGAECDFEHMIPTSHRYWNRSMNEDFWAVTNFSNI